MSDHETGSIETATPERQVAPAVAAQPSAKKSRAAWSEVQWAIVLLWPLVIAAGLYVTVNKQNQAIRDDLAARPPIAVIDVTSYLQKQLGPGSTDEDMQRALLRTSQAAEKLQGAGYLVFRAHDVYAYPAAVEAKP